MDGVTLFAGIGGVSCGMKMAGVDSIASVELDVENRPYSENCERVYNLNFDGDFYLHTVKEAIPWLPHCDILQASPVCKNFSPVARLNCSEEMLQDIALAEETVAAIARCTPEYFFLEQVPDYATSRSLEIIQAYLAREGYIVNCDTLDLADYGIPQSRKRFFLLAGKNRVWRFPEPRTRTGWKAAIAGIKLESSKLNERQINTLLGKLDLGGLDLKKGILIQRNGLSAAVRSHDQPCWTITRSCFTSGNVNAKDRKESINMVNTEGFWSLPTRAIARLCGFPDSYKLDGDHVGQGLGYAVPPRFVKQLIDTIPVSEIRSV